MGLIALDKQAQRAYVGRVTAKEFNATLKALGLTQVGAARLLGVDDRTCRKWSAGDRSIPEPVARFLSFIIATSVTPDEVMKVLGR